ncbi:hypothetical protein COS55_00545 [Candidatus Shapirobacteria bacterium CG03_land_8_20_14_0_80_40_19]|uniref:Fido domain-containing protein n=3 Tax=Candidatus Shapironibacteriota TaxID=1752721 RepID=A0A2M7BG21_9BACT|nr:MAG: hypothetical protein COV89_04145 [Candidatus Shapirobacteria bacterium CG11_big_fil_rev_8_21_14_0_20_40_12]PIV02061.1 MAG: hypothetical protein COS55_00545 [Candidatus Shapirobacteria bacterium CG03_land_8_20_14_0_80_40_19]PJC29290.1 MAG: hypothetical protein CO053_00180 [Candidatus Shapirobacteria bacterium CG_4_9_14_0_2_um_filter_40_11]
MRKITTAEVEYISFQLAKKLLGKEEPIPEFSTRFPNILESCLAVPFQKFSKRDIYPTLIDKASILYYLMIKNHPFQNGNKRIATTTLLVFLYKNYKWLKVDNQEFYNFSMWVAQSPAKLKDAVVDGTKKFIISYLIDLKKHVG